MDSLLSDKYEKWNELSKFQQRESSLPNDLINAFESLTQSFTDEVQSFFFLI